MANFIHQVKMENGIQAAIHIKGIITPEDAQRVVNVQMIQKMGLLVTTGKPQLLLDQAKKYHLLASSLPGTTSYQ